MKALTSNITIGSFKVKPSEVTWRCGVGNLVDTCVIKLPLIQYTRCSEENAYAIDVAKLPFKLGDKICVSLGYDNENTPRFMGFVSRIILGTPLVMECEGYAYQLRKIMFNKSYKQVTLRQLLSDLVEGTDIKLSTSINDLTMTNVWFKNCPGMKVLEWLQKECLCTVYFDFDSLYAGASRYTLDKAKHKLRIGWNVVEDKGLKKGVEDSPVQINVVVKNSAGEVKKTKSDQRKYSSVKEVKARAGLSESYLKKVVEEMQQDENFKGYEGAITVFLEPTFDKGSIAMVEDKRFPERSGNYFVTEVNGSYGPSGGRQKLTLKYYGK